MISKTVSIHPLMQTHKNMHNLNWWISYLIVPAIKLPELYPRCGAWCYCCVTCTGFTPNVYSGCRTHFDHIAGVAVQRLKIKDMAVLVSPLVK